MDVAVSLVVLATLSPLWFAIAIWIKADSPGPAVFLQWRVGRGHRLFRLYKFRTMRVGAEKDVLYLRDGSSFFSQIEDDPRLTRCGRLLRRFSLDEIPQLWNVLRGDMSLVGPRPLILEESNRMPRRALDRLEVRPGLSGYAQVEGRSEANVVDRFARDVYYVKNVSWKLDLWILWRTIGVVLKRDGVY